MYLLGEGVGKDAKRSYYWLKLAATQDQDNAGKLLAKVSRDLGDDTRAALDKEAAAFRPK
jgi:TPR repeat protein